MTSDGSGVLVRQGETIVQRTSPEHLALVAINRLAVVLPWRDRKGRVAAAKYAFRWRLQL